MTSFALSGDEQRAMEAGASAYLAKPYSPRELLAADPEARARGLRAPTAGAISKRTLVSALPNGHVLRHCPQGFLPDIKGVRAGREVAKRELAAAPVTA